MPEERQGEELPKGYAPSEYIPYMDYTPAPRYPGQPSYPAPGNPNPGAVPPVPPAPRYPGQPSYPNPGPVPPAPRYPTQPAYANFGNFPTYAPVPQPPPIYRNIPPAQRKRRRGRLIIVCVLIVLLLALIPIFFVVNYVNRSTPDKTLDAFCGALQQQDYQSAYAQFSTRLQHNFSETAFAAAFSQDKVVTCTHGTSDDSGTSATSTLKLVHDPDGINNDNVTLTMDSNNTWKIDDISRQP